MTILGLIAAFVVAGPPNSAADVVTLRDGSVILGQVVDQAPKGKVSLVVRRAWAEKSLPQKFKAWKAAEGGAVQKGKADRLRRLEEWKRAARRRPGREGRHDRPLAHVRDRSHEGEHRRHGADERDPQ